MTNLIKTYPCGLRTIVRPMPNFKSVCVSVYVGVGSRDELKSEFGLSHFCEHMLFKGTATRTGEQIANTLSGLGVDYNAYTSTNATCYHTRGLISNLDVCCDVLSDMYFNLKFADDEFHREAEVIVQEIFMHEDNPRSCLSMLAAETFYAGTEYGHEIAGTVKSVRAFKPQDIYNYIGKHYTAPKTIIAFAGNITPEQAEAMIKKYWLPHFKEKAKPSLRILGDNMLLPERTVARRSKDTEQQNVAVMFPVMNINHPDKYVMTFVNEIFASDMASRLFTSVRDKLGLVYTISGGLSLTQLGGFFYVYFSCTPKNTEKVLNVINSELFRLKAGGVTEEEMTKVRNVKLADRLFEEENVETINQRNATLLSEFNKIETTDEYLEKINKVTSKDVANAINKYLKYDNSIVAIVGRGIKVKPFEILRLKEIIK